MDAMINIAGADPLVVEAMAEAIVKVMTHGYDCRLGENEMRVALELLGRATNTAPTSITGCEFVSNPPRATRMRKLPGDGLEVS